MKNEATISIITATRNSVSFIADCMTSISQQDYKKFEHIIIDGASTDGSVDIIKKLLRTNSTFISEPDKGIYDAYNKGISLSTGEIIGFLNSDDFYASSKVLTQIAEAFNDPAVCAVYGDLEYVGQQDTSTVVRRWRGDQFNQKNLTFGWMPAHPTFYVRREWYSRIGGFDPNYKISADYLSILKLFSYSDFKSTYIPNCLVKMRVGGKSNKSISLMLRKSIEDWRALRSCHTGLTKSALSLVCKNISKVKQFLN
jgi:glycosyltransferase involved in cell wall biosynthesis